MSSAQLIRLDGPVDLAATLFPLRRGYRDPTTRVGAREAVRALRTPAGPATLRLTQVAPDAVEVRAVGPGADRAIEVEARGLVGADDDPAALVLADGDPLLPIRRRHPGVRLTRVAVMPVLFAAIVEQKVTGAEARHGWRGLVLGTSERAPGDDDLWLPPDPARVAETPSYTFHPWGIERRRAEVVRTVASRAARIEAFVASSELRAWLERLPGIGAWTTAETARLALGDPDAVSVGDYHLPHLVAWLLAREPRGDDERMLALLEPYEGQRGRVQRLLEATGVRPPAFGPRVEARPVARW
jgi:3-methyladenine DNA glycosylase/8-oxoguanine DNA glycosylase